MATPEDDSSYDIAPVSRSDRRLRLLFDPTSPAVTVAGIIMIVAGFVLIAVGWYDVSGTGSVALQMPYLVSGALTGLGLIVIGVATVAIGAKRQDADQRIRKLEQLVTMLRDDDGPDVDANGHGATNGERQRVSPRELLNYPAFRASVAFTAVAVAGLVVMVVTWWGVSGTFDVSSQVAYTVSGGLGGLALAVTGAGLLVSHVSRWAAAREDTALDTLLGAMAGATESRPRRTDRRRRNQRPQEAVDVLDSSVSSRRPGGAGAGRRGRGGND